MHGGENTSFSSAERAMREELEEGGGRGAAPWDTMRAKLQSVAALTPRKSWCDCTRGMAKSGVRNEGVPDYAAEAVHD